MSSSGNKVPNDPWSSIVRRAHNLEAGGSIPPSVTVFLKRLPGLLLLLYTYMKTLYESILDIDAPSRLENDVKTGIKHQKLIQEILKPIEHIIQMHHYSTQGGHVVTQDVYGLKGDIYVYEFTSTGKLAQDKKGVGVLQSMLKQAYRKYKPKNVDQIM